MRTGRDRLKRLSANIKSDLQALSMDYPGS